MEDGGAARAGTERMPEEEEVLEEDGLTIRRGSQEERGGMISRGSLPPAMCASTKPRFLPSALHHLFRPLEL